MQLAVASHVPRALEEEKKGPPPTRDEPTVMWRRGWGGCPPRRQKVLGSGGGGGWLLSSVSPPCFTQGPAKLVTLLQRGFPCLDVAGASVRTPALLKNVIIVEIGFPSGPEPRRSFTSPAVFPSTWFPPPATSGEASWPWLCRGDGEAPSRARAGD